MIQLQPIAADFIKQLATKENADPIFIQLFDKAKTYTNPVFVKRGSSILVMEQSQYDEIVSALAPLK